MVGEKKEGYNITNLKKKHDALAKHIKTSTAWKKIKKQTILDGRDMKSLKAFLDKWESYTEFYTKTLGSKTQKDLPKTQGVPEPPDEFLETVARFSASLRSPTSLVRKSWERETTHVEEWLDFIDQGYWSEEIQEIKKRIQEERVKTIERRAQAR